MTQIKLGEIISTRKGYAFKSTWYTDSGAPLVKVSNLTEDSVDTSNLTYIPDEIARDYYQYALETDDIVIQTVGSWPSNPASVVGKVVRIPSNASGALLNQNAVKIVPDNRVHKKYLYYLLKGNSFKDYIIGCAQGAASQASITLEAIRDFTFILHPLPIQRKIAAILSAYDDLIENNTRRIKILEEMAQTLYRHWFVDYKFPGHEDVGMVDSGTELGLVPEGWELKAVEDVLFTLESGSRPKGGIDPNESGVPSIGAENILGLGKYDYGKDKFISHEFFNNMNRGIVQHGDVLLYKDGAQLGRKSLFRDGFPHQVCCINEHVFILRCNEQCTQSYLYFWLDQPNMTQSIKNLNTNAAQPGISQPKVISLSILVPSKKILHIWDETAEPILALLFSLAKKNIILQRTRDLLLPKLINGELDVREVEIQGE